MSRFPNPVYAETILGPQFSESQKWLFEPMLEASEAHLLMLVQQQLMPVEQAGRVSRALQALRAGGADAFTYAPEVEDLFFQMEARILESAVRDKDLVARIGGEEFAIWMPHTPIESGLEVAERIRAGVESTAWRWNGEAYPLTISCGVAGYPDNASTVDSLRVIADAALYRAKQGGRNRVERAQGEPMRYTG